MRKISLFIITIGILSSFGIAEAKTISVRGYYKPSTGRYVAPSFKTSPNRTKIDNYSSKGNYNPFSGKKGTVNPYKYKW